MNYGDSGKDALVCLAGHVDIAPVNAGWKLRKLAAWMPLDDR
jgi:hypothetical protein